MFGIGFSELILILVVAFVIFGPKRLPDVARSLGKGMAEFRRATDGLRRDFEDSMQEGEEKTTPVPGGPSPYPETSPDKQADGIPSSPDSGAVPPVPQGESAGKVAVESPTGGPAGT